LSTIEQLRNDWRALYRQNKGSIEEREAYHLYIRATQGLKPPKEGRKQRIKQVTLAGLSESETFTLCNPETEISAPLPRQEKPQQANLF
jgi:hypothetical protein